MEAAAPTFAATTCGDRCGRSGGSTRRTTSAPSSLWKAYGSFGKYYDITKLEMPRGSFGAEHSITYYYTLDTFDLPGITCDAGPTGCPGTYIEQNDLRHAPNAVDPGL